MLFIVYKLCKSGITCIHRKDTRWMIFKVCTGLGLELKKLQNFLETFKNTVLLVEEVQNYIRIYGTLSEYRLINEKPVFEGIFLF